MKLLDDGELQEKCEGEWHNGWAGMLALVIARRNVSPLAATRALCLSGSPLDFFFRLHLRVVYYPTAYNKGH